MGGFTKMPFASTSLGAEQSLLNSELLDYATTFAAFLAGRWVAGMAAAALSVRGLATALVLLRGALIRTGIGALIVGAGELVYQFTRLVSGAGGFGEAMSLLKDLAVEVWERIKMGAAAADAAATAIFFDLKAEAASGMQSAIESVVGFGRFAKRGRGDGWIRKANASQGAQAYLTVRRAP